MGLQGLMRCLSVDYRMRLSVHRILIEAIAMVLAHTCYVRRIDCGAPRLAQEVL